VRWLQHTENGTANDLIGHRLGEFMRRLPPVRTGFEALSNLLTAHLDPAAIEAHNSRGALALLAAAPHGISGQRVVEAPLSKS
jgi:hypothetical protein